MKYHVIETTTQLNSTIEALIRFHNHLNIKREELDFLLQEFNKLNPNARPPKPYQKILMPIISEYYEKSHNHK
jgi:hypothetical protein